MLKSIISKCEKIIDDGTIKDDARALEVCLTKTIYRKNHKTIAGIALGKKRPYVLWIGEHKLYCSCDNYCFNKRPINNETGSFKTCKHLPALAIKAMIKHNVTKSFS